MPPLKTIPPKWGCSPKALPLQLAAFASHIQGHGQHADRVDYGRGRLDRLVMHHRDTVLCGSSTDVFLTCLATQANLDVSPQVIWRTRVGGIFQESIPAIHGDRAFILCSDGHLYAFE
jgi:hypothetical protein